MTATSGESERGIEESSPKDRAGADAFQLREVRAEDRTSLDAVADLHMELLGFGPMAGLGPRFIRDVCYATHMRDGTLSVTLCEVNETAAGFIAFTDRSIGFHRASLRKHWATAAFTLVVSLLQDPRRLASLYESLRVLLSRRGEARLGQDPMGEVVCVAVEPTFLKSAFVRRTGRRLSEELILHAARSLFARGVTEMRMLVDQDNRAVQLLYHRLGASFERYEYGARPTILVRFDLRELLGSDAGRGDSS